jgi:hypothetical protein
MVRCRECGGEVSSQAAVCPHCGVAEPAGAVAADAVRRHDGVGVRGHDAVRHDHAPVVHRRGGRGGWTLAILLLLVLLALFGLWYGNIVDFN